MNISCSVFVPVFMFIVLLCRYPADATAIPQKFFGSLLPNRIHHMIDCIVLFDRSTVPDCSWK